MSVTYQGGSTPPILVHCDSKHSIKNNKSSIKVDLQNFIERKKDELFLISLNSCQIPYTFYQLEEGLNDKIIYMVGEIEDFLIIPEGNYTAITFKSTVESLFLAKNIDFKMSYDLTRVTGKYSFTCSSEISFLNREDSPYKMFGFNLDEEYLIKPNIIFTSINPVTMHNIECIYVHLANLNYLNSINAQTGGFSDILCKMHVSTDPWSNINFHANMSQHKLLVNNDHISKFDIKLTDQDNNIIDLHNHNYQLSILIEHVIVPSLNPESLTLGLERIKSTKQIEDEADQQKPEIEGNIYTSIGINELESIVENVIIDTEIKSELIDLIEKHEAKMIS